MESLMLSRSPAHIPEVPWNGSKHRLCSDAAENHCGSNGNELGYSPRKCKTDVASPYTAQNETERSKDGQDDRGASVHGTDKKPRIMAAASQATFNFSCREPIPPALPGALLGQSSVPGHRPAPAWQDTGSAIEHATNGSASHSARAGGDGTSSWSMTPWHRMNQKRPSDRHSWVHSGYSTPRTPAGQQGVANTLSAASTAQDVDRTPSSSSLRRGVNINARNGLHVPGAFTGIRGSVWSQGVAVIRGSVWSQGIAVTHDSTRTMTTHNLFDYFICLIIFMNAATLGWQVDYEVQHVRKEVPGHFVVLEVIFFVIFVVEQLLRIHVHKWSIFTGAHWKWNVFDQSVVIMQLVEIFMTAIVGRREGLPVSTNILRLLRVVRIVRLLRIVRFIPELNKLVYLIMGSLWPFLWTITLLLLMIYILAVCFTQLVAEHWSQRDESLPVHMELNTFYGSLWTSVLSLFAATSGGVDWRDIIMPLVQEISPFLAVVFMCYIAFSVMVVMNLVTGVFVDGAKRLNRNERDAELIKKVSRIFTQCDLNENQEISWLELKSQLSSPHLVNLFRNIGLEHSEASTLFSLLDQDGTATLNAEEFVQGIIRLKGPAKAFELAELQQNHRSLTSMFVKKMDRVENQLHKLENLICKTTPVHDLPQFGSARS